VNLIHCCSFGSHGAVLVLVDFVHDDGESSLTLFRRQVIESFGFFAQKRLVIVIGIMLVILVKMFFIAEFDIDGFVRFGFGFRNGPTLNEGSPF